MPHICVTIGGQRHCFEIPLLVEVPRIKIPRPTNYPQLDLALTVEELVKVIQPLAPNSSLIKGLTDTVGQFIREVQANLPKGVELFREEAVQSKSV